MGMKINQLKKEMISAVLLAVILPSLPGNGGNVHAGKKLTPGFHIVFLGRKKEVPQLEGILRSEMLKQYRKRILDKRLLMHASHNLLTIKFPYLPIHGGTVHAGK